MKKKVLNKSFVFYATSLESIEDLESCYPELAHKLMKAILEYGIYGEYDNSDPLINANMRAIIKNIDNAKDRYNKAVENGKKGGRPKKYNEEDIITLHNQGFTNSQVADQIGCSLSTVEKTISKHKKDNIFLRDVSKNQKNLYVDEDVDDDKDVDDDVNVDANKELFNSSSKNTVPTAITIEEFYRLGETREAALNESRTEATFFDTGEIVKIIYPNSNIEYEWEG